MSTDMCLYLYVILRARLDWAETAEMPVCVSAFFFFFFTCMRPFLLFIYCCGYCS